MYRVQLRFQTGTAHENPPKISQFQDWTTLVRGISEGQKQRFDKIKEAILKFISAGLDQQYSPKDPIRAWLSFMKRSDEAPGIHKKLLAEVSTLGEKPYKNFVIRFSEHSYPKHPSSYVQKFKHYQKSCEY